MYLHFLQTLILKFQEKHQITYSLKRLIVNYLKTTIKKRKKKKKKEKTLNRLTIRVDYERINGHYTNAEYRGKITRCDLKLNIKYRPVRRGGAGEGGGGGVRSHPPPSWANYFKFMHILTRNC